MADQPLSDRDLWMVAQSIPPDNLIKIAVEFLDLEKCDVDFIKANAKQQDKTVEEIHFDCLIKWKNKKGIKATRKALHDCIQSASETGCMDRSKLGFLIDTASFNITLMVFIL